MPSKGTRHRRRPLSEKTFFEMDDLETARAWDGILESLDGGLLADARKGDKRIRIAAAVLELANGGRRLVSANSEAGDGEGTLPVADLVARARSHLAAGEAISLELVEAILQPDSSWNLVARKQRAKRSRVMDEISSSRSIRKHLELARKRVDEVLGSVALVRALSGERNVVFFDCELGGDEARSDVADLIRRIGRLSLLKQGESLERWRVRLVRSDTGWYAASALDPLAVAKRRRSALRKR